MGTSAAPETVAVPAGRVALSDRRTRRSWQVDLAAYHMAVHPVTQDQYAEITRRRPGAARGTRLPVEGVSWWDAIRYCNALSERTGLTPAYHVRGDDIEWDTTADGYRLPTEAE